MSRFFFALLVVAITAGIVVGCYCGVLTMQGSDVSVRFGWIQGDSFDAQYHDFYMTTSIYNFVTILAAPIALLAIIAAAIFGRNAEQRDSA